MPDFYNEFANLSGVNDEASADVNNELESTYTKEDESRARKAAEEAVRRESARGVADKARTYGTQINAELEALKAEREAIKAEREEYRRTQAAMKAEMDALKNSYTSVRGDIDTHTERMILDEVAKEEEQLINDPTIGSLYDRSAIRKILADEARAGRILTPKEALALKEFDRLAKENAELKQTIDHRKRFFENPIGIPASRVADSAELSGVNDLSSATAYAKKLAKNKFGY